MLYVAHRSYSGSFCPLSMGCRTCCSRPLLSIDGTLSLIVGNEVLVSRWRKYWYYGVLMENQGDYLQPVPASRGWFPAKCVKEVPAGYLDSGEKHSGSEKKLL
ncbi:unnamed protein product [Soboliphyme baturini]|uniref:SH3 domain-containing protein n=1 Tax=Soboliphyme baturini TaxID=241478 RepID=A0A183J6S8_9BILA|nr:unnamed protein product [Soboliphyme baturini]